MNFARYLKICAWAYRRYTHHGRTVLYQGPNKMQYLRIEESAWHKYVTY
jgi:hypothetical protein